VARYDATAQTANISAQTLVTPSVNTLYRASCIVVLTTAATTSSTTPACYVSFTDADSNVAYGTNVAISGYKSGNVVGYSTWSNSSVFIYAKSGVAVQVGTTAYASSGATSMQYAVHFTLEEVPGT
jgi:hypothetical protein